MSRRNISKKNFPGPDPIYNNLLVSLLIARIIKKGKKNLAQKIIKDSFEMIETTTSIDSIIIFKKAVKNVTPIVQVKASRVGGSTYQIPIEVSSFKGTTLSLKWILNAAKSRPGKTFALRLANEIIDASNLIGGAIRKRDETHKMAEANKAFSHFRY